jgi:nucleoside-diphosphate-sugar epimerase
VARALIVGCGCRGRELGRNLLDSGWAVRGTTRVEARCAQIESAGIEAMVADPDRAITVLDAIDGVTVLCWLLGSAVGSREALAAIHGPRLERVLEEVVDTPVRGIVYESGGTVAARHREAGERALRAAEERWRIRYELVTSDPSNHRAWTAAARAAVDRLVA